MSGVVAKIFDKRRGWLLAVVVLLVMAALVVWRMLPTSKTTPLVVVNLGDEVVALELYGAGLEHPVSSGPLASQQQLPLMLAVRDDGELRLHAVSTRASVDSQLLPQAAQLREMSLQLQVRDGAQFVLVPAP